MPKIGSGLFMPISCQGGAKMQEERNYWHRDGFINLATFVLVVDCDYAAKVFHFIKDKSSEELNLFHWKRNFDLYTLVHSSYHYWSDRSIEVKVIKSHSLYESKTPRDRYEHLGNEFADLAAKTIAKDQGIVEFFQTRSSLWTYVEKAEMDWKSFYELCYGVAQKFLNAEEIDHPSTASPTLPNNGSLDLSCPHVEMESPFPVVTNMDLFDLGDPYHRRRQMSSYGATYNRCLLAF